MSKETRELWKRLEDMGEIAKMQRFERQADKIAKQICKAVKDHNGSVANQKAAIRRIQRNLQNGVS
jgi:hypothetical protein